MFFGGGTMSFNRELQREVDRWVKEGLITSATAEILRQRYPVTKTSMTQTLALLGSILLGIGVILFFAANWESMSRTLKVAVVVSSFTLAYLGGYYLRYTKGTYPKVGYALICLGSLLYGSGIWLIAQIFHIEAERGLGFMLWYVGVIPIAYLFHSSFNLFLALATLTSWFIAGKYPLNWAFLLYPLLLAGTILPLALRKKDQFNFTAAVIAGYIWFIPLGVKLARVNFSFQLGIISLLLFSLLLYFLLQLFREEKSIFGENLLFSLSLVGMFAALAAFSFNDFLHEFLDKHPLYNFPYLVAAVLLVIGVMKFKEKSLTVRDLPLGLLYLLVFPFFPETARNSFLLIFNNIFFFVYTLLAIYYGYWLKRPLIFNLSMVMFAVAVVLKYFDFFFALLPRSVFFMSGGLLLLLGSIFLEHKRRKLIKTME